MKRNPHLIAMTILGALLLVAGTLVGIDAYFAAERGVIGPAQAGGALGVGISMTSLGALLLLIAWTVAAARWRSNDH